ncbi:MAG: hypothetical protein IIY32_09910, partial [Thermoguttaceae bacterium]|nr:hypothetical protein [Thermoguttaceae bacterium]
MKRQNNVRRNGAVLLLILGIMAMFAISILTYMVVTSNMAETAQNSAKLDAVLEIPVQEDVDQALKNVVIGSNNERNPIGPFSILENMYGDWKEYSNVYDGSGNLTDVTENSSVDFLANIDIFPNLGYAIVIPAETPDGQGLTNGSMNDAEARREVLALFENSGGVMTFLKPQSFPNEAAENDWASDVQSSSAFILEKVITCPTNLCYKEATGVAGDYWHFKVELTDDLKRFANDYCGNTPSNINSFNTFNPTVYVRLNRPAYSGTGAGGFTPGQAKDASVTPEIKSAVASSYGDQADQFRIPFAFWANAAAPDLYPFYRTVSSSKLSFRSYWAQLTDVNYDAHQRENSGALRYAYLDSGTNS